jgi:hypothetical protein
MLEIIKTIRICDSFDLTLVRFTSSNGYEVQYSTLEDIIDTDGQYSTKREGLKAFNRFFKSLIKEGNIK